MHPFLLYMNVEFMVGNSSKWEAVHAQSFQTCVDNL